MTPDALLNAATEALRAFFSTLFETDCVLEATALESLQAPADHRLAVGVNEDGVSLFEIAVSAQVGAGIEGMDPGKLAAAYEQAGGVQRNVRFASPKAAESPSTVAEERAFRVETPYGPAEGVIRVAAGSTAAPRPVAPETAAVPGTTGVKVAPAAFTNLGAEDLGGDGSAHPASFALLREVELEITVELGRRSLPLAQVLRLAAGSVLELDRLVGEPLGIYANGHLIAEGEAVVLGEQLGVRVTRLVAGGAAVLAPS